MQESQIKLSSFFDASDASSVKEIINYLENVEKTFKGAVKVIKSETVELKKALDSVKNTGDALEKVTKPNQQQKQHLQALTAEYKEVQKQVLGYEKTIKSLQSELGKLKRSKNSIPTPTSAEIGSLKQVEDRVKSLRAQLKGMKEDNPLREGLLKEFEELSPVVQKGNKALNDAKRGVKVLAGSYYEIQQEVSELKVRMKSLTDIEGANRIEGERLARTIREKTDVLKKLDSQVGDNFRRVGSYSEALEGLQGAFSALQGQPSLAGAFQGVQGLAAGAGVALGPIAGAVATVGLLAEGLDGAAQEIAIINGQLTATNKLTGLTGEGLERFTARLRATAKTFDESFEDIEKSVNAIAVQFDLGYDEALDKLQEGLINSANLQRQLTDDVYEYSSQLAQAGGTAEELFEILEKSEKLNIYSDKGIDTLKESAIRLRENTKAVQDALKPFSELKRSQIEAAVASNQTIKAIELVAEELETGKYTAQEYQRVISDVLGASAGEDAGRGIVKVLANLSDEIKEGGNELSVYQQKQQDLLRSTEALELETVRFSNTFQGVGTSIEIVTNSIKTRLIGTLNDAISAFQDSSVAVGEYRKGLEKLENLSAARFEVNRLKEDIKNFTEETGEGFGQLFTDKGFFNLLNDVFSFQALGTTSKEQLAALKTNLSDVTGKYKEIEKAGGNYQDLELSLGATYSQQTQRISQLKQAQTDLNRVRLEARIEAEQRTYDNSAEFEKVESLTRLTALQVEQIEFEKQAAIEAEREKVKAAKQSAIEQIKAAENIYNANKQRVEERRKALEITEAKYSEITKDNQEELGRATADHKGYLVELEKEFAAKREAILIGSERKFEALQSASRDKFLQDARVTQDEYLQRLQAAKQAEFELRQSQVGNNVSNAESNYQTASQEGSKQEALRALEYLTDQRIQQVELLKEIELDALNEITQAERESINQRYADKQQAFNEFKAQQEKLLQLGQVSEQQYNDIVAQADEQAKANQEQHFKEIEALEREHYNKREKIVNQGEAELNRIKKEAQDATKFSKGVQGLQEDLGKFLADYGAAIQTTIGLTNSLYQESIDKYSQQLTALEAAKNREIELTGNNEQAKMLISEKYAEKEKQIRRKQAEAEKKQKVFQATTSAITGAANAFSSVPFPFNIVVSALVLGLGLRQAARIASTPIPQFFKGREDGPATLATVDERGAEIVHKKRTGEMILGTNKGSRLTYLEKGDKVYTADKTRQILAEMAYNRSANDSIQAFKAPQEELSERTQAVSIVNTTSSHLSAKNNQDLTLMASTLLSMKRSTQRIAENTKPAKTLSSSTGYWADKYRR
jgi:hypothetical protein